MKISVFKRKQRLSFLPVKVSVNDSLYKLLQPDKTTDFEIDTPNAKFTLNLFGMKKSFEFDIEAVDNANYEMYFNLDKNQSLMVGLGFCGVVFLTISSVLTHNMVNLFIASSMFIIISCVTLSHSMQLSTKEK